MGIPVYDRTDRGRIGKVVEWGEQMMGQLKEPAPPLPNQQNNYAIRGYLLQNIYGGGSGLMALAYRAENRASSQISIVGTNYVANSQFKLQLTGSLAPTNAQPDPQQNILFTSGPIPVNTSASDLEAILLLAAQTAGKPVRRGDITVTLGNPMSVPSAVIAPPQPDLVITDTDIQSYIGSWVIVISGALLNMFDVLEFNVVQDTQAFMRGASGLVQRTVVDLPGTTVQPVFDVQNRPVDYPWVAGSLCGAVWYADLGYGIQWSDFRNQELSIPVSSS